MTESQVVLEWTRKARQEAQRETQQADLLRVLESRFGGNVPAEVRSAVTGQTDLAVLDRWFDKALTAFSLDEFRAAVNGS